MSEERYRIVFLGLSDDLPGTEAKFRENISKVFKIAGAQIDKLIAKSPVIINKDLNKEKAETIAKKLEMIGGKVSIESDKTVPTEDRAIVQREKTTGKFNIYINKIESEDAKHGIANYLNSILDMNYIEIRNELLGQTPAVLPGEYDYEKAKEIRNNLEKFGSRVSISKTRGVDSRPYKIHARNKRRDAAILVGIVLITLLAFMLLIKIFKYEGKGFETISNMIDEQVVETRGNKTENEPHLPLAKEAVEALRELEGRCRADISYSEYVKVLGDTKSQVDAYLESQEAESRIRIANSILNVLIHYQNAAEIWGYKNKYNRSHVRKTREDVQLYLRRYPSVSKRLSEGGAIDDAGGREDTLQIDAVVSIVMHEASKELKKVLELLKMSPPIS